MKTIDWKKLLVALIIPQVVGGLGAIATTPKISSWYQSLNKPFFSPPNWVFGPVWTLLFVAMGVAMYLVWKKKKIISNWYWVQLGLNLLWSVLFFGLESPGLALIEIILLWVAIRKTIVAFGKVSRVAGKILIPYLAWVSFATLLNAGVWWLNMR